MIRRIDLPLVVALAALLVSSPDRLAGQQNSMSDISGASTTGSTIAGGTYSPTPGTVAVEATPAVAAAVSTAATTATGQLAASALTSTTGVAIPPAVQAAILGVLTGVAPSAAIVTALGTGGATQQAAALADALVGLASSPSPGQLANAVGQYNALVLASDAGFLANPPAEFLAVQSVLAQMVAAAQIAG